MLFLRKTETNFLIFVIKKKYRSKNSLSNSIIPTESTKVSFIQKRVISVTDYHSKNIITFPVDQHLSKDELNYVIKTVKEFMKQSNENWIPYVNLIKQFSEEKNIY